MNQKISYRVMEVSDIPAGLKLCRSAGWNQTDADWELFLHLDPGGGRVAVDGEGNVVGTITTVRYENRLCWIGMVLVDPQYQRQGIGLRLMEEGLKSLQHERSIKLDATPYGRAVYLKLGFREEVDFCRMSCLLIKRDLLPASGAIRMNEDDFNKILDWDREVFGADRRELLRQLFQRTPQFCFVNKKESEITGYCLGRVGYDFNQIGPVIARTTEDAISVVAAACCNALTRPVVLDVLNGSDFWISWLSGIGFEEQRRFFRMYLGSNDSGSDTKAQFSIVGPEFG